MVLGATVGLGANTPLDLAAEGIQRRLLTDITRKLKELEYWAVCQSSGSDLVGVQGLVELLAPLTAWGIGLAYEVGERLSRARSDLERYFPARAPIRFGVNDPLYWALAMPAPRRLARTPLAEQMNVDPSLRSALLESYERTHFAEDDEGTATGGRRSSLRAPTQTECWRSRGGPPGRPAATSWRCWSWWPSPDRRIGWSCRRPGNARTS